LGSSTACASDFTVATKFSKPADYGGNIHASPGQWSSVVEAIWYSEGPIVKERCHPAGAILMTVSRRLV
jgi:hypothetical protein